MASTGNPLDQMGNDARAMTVQNDAQRKQNQQDELKRQTAPHVMAITGLQKKLEGIDQKANPNEYAGTVNEIQNHVHAIREAYHPDAKLGIGDWLKTYTTDRMHITNHDARVKDIAAKNAASVAQDSSQAQAYAQGSTTSSNEYNVEKQKLKDAGFSQEQIDKALENKAGLTAKLSPDGPPYKGTDGKWYQNYKDTTGQITSREMPPNYAGPTGGVDAGKRADFAEAVKNGFKGNYEEFLKNPSGVAKVGTPKAGVSGGKNVFAILTDQGWQDAGTKQPLKDFRPAPSFAQTGLWGVDPVQNTDGSIGSAMVNRRTGETKQITGPGGTPLAPALLAQVNKSIEPALESETRLSVMEQNAKDALDGNQQAMLSLVANHIGMTLGAQKGAKISQAVWNEAVGTAPWMENIQKKFGPDGYLQGVTLSPRQVKQMLELGKQRRDLQWKQAQQAGQTYGVNVPIPGDAKTPEGPNGPKKQHLDSMKGKGGKSLADRLSEAYGGK